MIRLLDEEEAEIAVVALGEYLARRGANAPALAVILSRELTTAVLRKRRLREPVTVGLTINGDEYFAMLNPETNEVEVRFQGAPVMSGEWRKPWFREGIDEEPEHESIQRRDEYPNQPQPDNATLEVLSVALRHTLVNR
jgi:hypothetical protein